MSVRKSVNDDTARKPVDGKNFTTALPAKRSEKVKGARIGSRLYKFGGRTGAIIR